MRSSAAHSPGRAHTSRGYFVSDANCGAAASHGVHALPVELALAIAAGVAVLAAEAAAFLVYRATADVDKDAPGPYGRLHFFALAALLGNVLFFVIVVFDGAGTIIHLPCSGS